MLAGTLVVRERTAVSRLATGTAWNHQAQWGAPGVVQRATPGGTAGRSGRLARRSGPRLGVAALAPARALALGRDERERPGARPREPVPRRTERVHRRGPGPSGLGPGVETLAPGGGSDRAHGPRGVPRSRGPGEVRPGLIAQSVPRSPRRTPLARRTLIPTTDARRARGRGSDEPSDQGYDRRRRSREDPDRHGKGRREPALHRRQVGGRLGGHLRGRQPRHRGGRGHGPQRHRRRRRRRRRGRERSVAGVGGDTSRRARRAHGPSRRGHLGPRRRAARRS